MTMKINILFLYLFLLTIDMVILVLLFICIEENFRTMVNYKKKESHISICLLFLKHKFQNEVKSLII